MPDSRFLSGRRASAGHWLVGLLAVCSTATAQAQFENDARWAPAQTNMLVLVNSGRIFESPLARQERAAEKSRAAFQSGVSIVSPDVDRLLIASHVDLEVMHTLWTAAVFSRAKNRFDLNEIANRSGASVDPVGTHNTVLLPNDATLVELGPEAVGVMKPANRQAVARWLREAAGGGSSSLSPYLKQAVSFADKNADVIIALDLADVLTPAGVRERLASINSISQADADKMAGLLAGLRGVTLGVTIRDSITGSIKADFSSDCKALEASGKALLSEILGNRGMMIDDIAGWTARANGQELVISGPLSIAGLRAITSMVSQPMLPEMAEDTAAGSAAWARTKTYFNSLETYVQELTSKAPEYRTLKSYAVWFENYANRIDGFSVLGVDPDLVNVGVGIADSLREMATILRETNLDQRQKQAELRANAGANYGYYDGYGGYYRYNNNRTKQRDALKAMAAGDAETKAREIMRAITDDLNTARRDMSTKYNVDF